MRKIAYFVGLNPILSLVDIQSILSTKQKVEAKAKGIYYFQTKSKHINLHSL